MAVLGTREGFCQGYVPQPQLSQSGLPAPAEALQFLARFRQAFNSEPCYLEFDLQELPRRGDERQFHGRLWRGRGEDGPIARLSFSGQDGGEHRLLVQSGTRSALWTFDGNAAIPQQAEALFSPVLPGLEMTPFDLQMPFFYWQDVRLTAVTRIRGRPSYVFVFRPPADFNVGNSGLTAVRAYLDTEFEAPVQFEVLGKSGGVLKTWSLLDMKQVQGRWIVREVDVRNDATRDKARFIVTGVAFDPSLPTGLFEPGRLADVMGPPPADRIAHIGP